MSKVVTTDDRPNKSDGHYPASKKKTPPPAKKKFIPKGFMRVDQQTSTLSLKS